MVTTVSLKQGKTRTSRGPIPHPLMSKNNHALQKTESVILDRLVKLLDVRSRCLYLLCKFNNFMVTIIRHIFTDIFQMEHFCSIVKFLMGYEKNKRFLLIYLKTSEKTQKIGTGSLNTKTIVSRYYPKYNHRPSGVYIVLTDAFHSPSNS